MRHFRLVLPVLGLAVLAGCKGSENPVAPAVPLTLSLSASPMVGHFSVAGSDSLYTCSFQVTAAVSGGRTGEQIIFDNGVINWSLNGTFHAPPLEITTGVTPLPSDYFAKYFKTSGFAAGQLPASATLYLAWGSAPVPFNAQLVARYHVLEQGSSAPSDTRIATVALNCQ